MSAPLGIGGHTPYHQRSNYTTARNHCHRDVTPTKASSHTKVKCSYCGLWVRKGENCRYCDKTAPQPGIARNNNQRPSVESAYVWTRSPRTQSASPRQHSPRYSNMSDRLFSIGGIGGHDPYVQSAYQLTPRQREEFERQRHLMESQLHESEVTHSRVKCTNCGCWMVRGAPCSLCRKVARLLA